MATWEVYGTCQTVLNHYGRPCVKSHYLWARNWTEANAIAKASDVTVDGKLTSLPRLMNNDPNDPAREEIRKRDTDWIGFLPPGWDEQFYIEAEEERNKTKEFLEAKPND